MKSKHWDNITTTVRNKINLPKGTMLLTEKQWLDRGYKPLSDDAGEKLWTNQYCQAWAKYLFLDEVTELTEEEKKKLKEWKKAHTKELKRIRESKAGETLATLKADYKELRRAFNELHFLANKMENTQISIIKKAIETILSERTYEPKSKAIVLDTETTGLDSTDELLQVSIIDTDGNLLYNSYIQPLFHESWEKAESINHISKDMVQNAPTIFEEAKKIADILDGTATIIGYSVDFDINMLTKFGITINNQTQIIDLLPVFSEIYGDWNEFYQSYKWKSLATCADFYGYKWEMDAHNSLADCLATLHCYKKMIERNEL